MDIVIGVAILVFVILGLREGAVKAALSLILLFLSVFLATSFLDFLGKGLAQFNNPHYLGSIVVFLAVAGIFFLFFDFVLTVLFNKVICITILGPVDRVVGVLVGGFKGVLICGIVFQSILNLPLSSQNKQHLADSRLLRFTIQAYQRAHPYAKKVFPMLNEFMQENVLEKVEKNGALKQGVEEIKKKGAKEIEQQAGRAKELLKEEKLLPSVPEGEVR